MEEMTEDWAPPLPAAIELAWGRRAKPGSAATRDLSLDRVAATGITVAQREGPDALSVARVARELGIGTSSLRRYVSTKEELVDLMVDVALGPPPRPRPRPGEDWRSGLTRWAFGLRAASHRHDWALQLPARGRPLGPNSVRWLEAALGSLDGARLTNGQKVSTVLLLRGFVRYEATLTAKEAMTDPAALADYADALATLADPNQFPALHRVLSSGVLDEEDDPDQEFRFGLGCILDGVDALMRRAGTPPG